MSIGFDVRETSANERFYPSLTSSAEGCLGAVSTTGERLATCTLPAKVGANRVQNRLRPASSSWRVEQATSGDHLMIHPLLVQVLHQPSLAEFHATLDRPDYEAAERLLIRHPHAQRLLGHLQTQLQTLRFGQATIPSLNCSDLAVLPELGSAGLDAALICKAAELARRQGAVLLTTRTTRPQAYLAEGWIPCGGQVHSTTAPGNLAAVLPQPEARLTAYDERRQVSHVVRVWRQVEEEVLGQLYDEYSPSLYGRPLRDRDYLHWVLMRHAFERIYVAVEFTGNSPVQSADSPDPLLLGGAPVVAYAVVRHGNIIELSDRSHNRLASAALLKRICADAFERGRHAISYWGASNDPLHAWFARAGGQTAGWQPESRVADLAFVPNGGKFLRAICSELQQRTKHTEVARGGCLGVCLGDEERHTIILNPRSVRISSGPLPTDTIRLGRAAGMQMLLGHRSAEELQRAHLLTATTSRAEQLATVLFPRRPWYRPLLDDLRIE